MRNLLIGTNLGAYQNQRQSARRRVEFVLVVS